jgi:glycosyltransferase involved in cell wall biosynthesis
MSGAFSYPVRSYDRALSAAGAVERLARAALRQLRSGRLDAARSALSWRVAAPAAETEICDEAVQPPVLYLPAVSWSYRFQRPQHLARALARAGHPVLYVDGFLRSRLLPSRHLLLCQGGLHVLRMRVPGRPDPYREPLDRRTAARMADTILAGLQHEKPFMVLVQLPFWAELGRELARRLRVPLVYDRIDLHVGFPGVPASRIESAEALLIRESDLVCATAGLLAERPRQVSPRVLLLPNGVDLAAFPTPALVREETAGELCVGYVGALGPWFDLEAVAAAAVAFPEWRFRLAGQVEDLDIAELAARLPNLETVGEIPFTDVPQFLASLAVALVPFRDLPLTRAVDPVKLYEALAMGLPVVARRLPETERWAEPLVYLYDTPADLVRQVHRAAQERTPELALLRRQAAAEESWDRRAAELLRAVAELASDPP